MLTSPTRRTGRRSAAVLALLLAAAAATAQPSREGLSHLELRQQLTPVWERLQTDSRFLALRQELDRHPFDPKVVERYLRFLPLSPLDYLKIDMWQRRYEHVVPKYIVEWHERWIALHESRARRLYGDDYVDRKLAPSGRGPRDGSAAAAPPGVAPVVGTNRNVASTFSPEPETYQGEIQVAVNPNNPNQIVAAANTWDDIGGSCGNGIQAVFYSSDGGATWGYTCPPDDSGYAGMSCAGSVFGSDPAVYWNDANEVFLNHMLLCSSGGTQYAMVVARSADGGATWSAQGIIKNSWGTGDLEDKNFYVVDNNPSSPFYGRHYTCWDRNNDEKFAYSTDNGQSWTEVDLPTSSGGGSGSRFDLGCEIAVEDDGTVHVIFDTLSCLSTCNNEEMFYVRSTNGGVSWSSAQEIRDFNLVGFSNNSCPDAQDERCIGPFGAIDVDNSGGACDGNLYVTYSDFSSGDGNNADVFMIRSTDGGSSWSAPVTINDDGLSNRAQFHPFLVVDQSDGSVVVAWHDARNDSGNDAVDFFVARSTDCGLSFEENIQASQPSSEFNNSGISFSNENSSDNPANNPNQYGEYLGLDARDGKAYIAWTDTRHYFPSFGSESQEENVGFAIVEFDDAGNTPPDVTITSPADGSSFEEGASVSFAGTASDAEDGDLTAGLAWTSSRDGAIGSGGSFSTSSLSVGTHTITAAVTDSGGAEGSDQIAVTITGIGGDPLSEDFEGGLGSWTAGGLWHHVSSSPCASPGYSSPVSSVYYGQDSTCSYDAGDNTGDLISPAISGIVSGSELSFQFYRHVELYTGGSYDRTEVAVSVAGSGSWTTVWSRDSTDTSQAAWISSGPISLASWAGDDIQLRFRFDTVDGSFNDFTGWFIDDVVVTGDGGGNTPPSVSIGSPADGSSFPEGTNVSFAGSASDAEDGDLTASLAWTSSLDGAIGSGGSFSTVLSVGTHAITASVTDSGGSEGSDQITVTIDPNTPPVVTIGSPADGSSFTEGTSVSFSGSASDAEDGDLTGGLAWTSSLDGAIGSGGSFSTSSLSVGGHTITAMVTDSGGAPGSDSIGITIDPAGGGCADCIDWNVTTTVSYSTQDVDSDFAVEDGGDTLALFENTWRRTTQTFVITPNTVVEVEFSSSAQGEIHGIGFDENDTLNDATRIFQLHGTQNWSNAFHDFDNYDGSGDFTTYQIPVGQFYTGTMWLVLVNDHDSGSGNNSRFRNVRIFEETPPPGSCAADVDFTGGASGWTNSGASTCSTGDFVAATPTEVVNGGVTTQVGGDHTTGSGNAFFSAVNTSAGVNDVDGGNCTVTSPVYAVSEASDVSVWYFHGQRDAGDDPGDDFFLLEMSTNGGSTWTTLASFGDVTVNAAWTEATAAVSAGDNVQFRIQVSDGSGPGDLVEAGVDDVSICPTE